MDEELVAALERCRRAQEQPQAEEYHHRWTLGWRYCTQLHIAAHLGLRAYVRRLVAEQDKQEEHSAESLWRLGQHEDEFFARGEGWDNTPIGLACLGSHLDIVRMLWPSDVAGLARTGVGHHLISHAVSRSDVALLDFLLQAGLRTSPEVNPRTSFGGRLTDHRQDTSAPCLARLLPHLGDEEVRRRLCFYAALGLDSMLQVVLSDPRGDVATWKTGNGTAAYQTCAAVIKTAGHAACLKLLLPWLADVDGRETVPQYGRSGAASPQPQKERTLLHAVAGAWHDGNHAVSRQMCELLLGRGADLEARDGSGDTPVLCLFPCHYNRSVRKPLRYLLERGASVSVRDAEGLSLMHRAVHRHIDVRLLKILVAHGADVNAVPPQEARRPQPALACMWDTWDMSNMGIFSETEGHERVGPNTQAEVAAFLVSAGATIDAGGDPDGVLHSALEACDADTFRLLLGARVAAMDRPLASIGQVFFSIGSQLQPDNTIDGQPDARDPAAFVQALLDAGVSTEVRDDKGATPLLRAVAHRTVFEALVRAGADKNATDGQGRGVLLQLMTVDGWNPPTLERLRELVDAGFDPLQVNHEGNSLLHFAISRSGPYFNANHSKSQRDPWLFPFLAQLLDYGLSVRATNCRGLTPLHCLFDVRFQSHHGGRGFTAEHLGDILEFLAAAPGGFDINARDDEGVTPLHLAAVSTRRESIAWVRTLIEHGADVQVCARDGRNALHLAARARNSAAAGYLAAHAPRLMPAVDAQGRTPLFDASISGVAETVATLLRAGADARAVDAQGWTPLHACAEFPAEQRHWTAPEDAVLAGAKSADAASVDRYRPYMPGVRLSRSGTKGKKHLVDHLQWDNARDEAVNGKAYILESTGLAIQAVVDVLVAAGADPDAISPGPRPGTVFTPAQRAASLGCDEVVAALERHHRRGSLPSTTSPALMSAEERQALLRDPWQHMASLTLADLAWLQDHGANLFMTLRKDADQNSLLQRDFFRAYSFLECLALAGLGSALAALGDAVQRTQGPEDKTPLDPWTVEMIASNAQAYLPGKKRHGPRIHRTWDLASLATVADYLRPTQWEVHPLLGVALHRVAPNLETVRVLVEQCGVDVHAPTVRYAGDSSSEICKRTTVLHLAASQQQFWHLDAIRYLVAHGADLHAPDFVDQTPLHCACAASPGPWQTAFLDLLLELGADAHARDSQGRTSLDLVQSGAVMSAFVRRRVQVSPEEATRLLWLGIGQLDAVLVRGALDLGADPNRPEDKPVYTHKELDWEVHSTALFEKYRALPLQGAVLYSDYLQDQRSRKGENRRAGVVRLLIKRGADVFATVPKAEQEQQREGEDSKPPARLLHSLFEWVRCGRECLEVFLDYAPCSIDLNVRDSRGRTVFLAACDSMMSWRDEYSKDAWDSSDLFLQMLDRGADAAAVDALGDNALVCFPYSPLHPPFLLFPFYFCQPPLDS